MLQQRPSAAKKKKKDIWGKGIPGSEVLGSVWGTEKKARVETVVRRVLDRHVAGVSRGEGPYGAGTVLCTLVLRCEMGSHGRILKTEVIESGSFFHRITRMAELRVAERR